MEQLMISAMTYVLIPIAVSLISSDIYGKINNHSSSTANSSEWFCIKFSLTVFNVGIEITLLKIKLR